MRIPKISICIDVYNYGEFLAEAIESVLNQDFGDFEIIVMDDCSEDDSFEIAQGYAERDERVMAGRNPANLGMVKNRNVCLRQARGEYVKILHADDFLCRTDALGRMSAVLDDHPGMSLVACPCRIVGISPQKARPRPFDLGAPVTGVSIINRCLREGRNLIGSPSGTMFRRSRGLRGFDEGFFNSADWEMWFHLLEQGCFGAIPESLVAYRRHAGQQTEKDKFTASESQDLLGILDRYLDQPYCTLSKFRKSYLRRRALAKFASRRRHLQLPGKTAGGPGPASAGLFALGQIFKLQQLLQYPRRAAPRELEKFTPGVNVAGFFQGEYGIGDSSRAYCRVIGESELPAAFLNIQSRNHRNLDRSIDQFSATNPHSINLMTFSFDYSRRFFRDQNPRYFRGRYNVALWYWELEKFPSRWHSCFEYYDEIWTATDFCQKSLAQVSPVPVIKIGYPFLQDEAPAPHRSGLGLDAGAYVFLFTFDFHSVVQRKNPGAVIAAFKEAFGGNQQKACLILKSINARHYPEQSAELRRATGGLNVIWMDEHLDSAGMKRLFATADCYVSLHRSEGLGLGMAQAMSFGKPVIATGYSGNLDFTTPANSLLVRYQLMELERDYGVYEKGNFWAEPDVGHAAGQMRWAFENPGEARQLGQRARTDLRLALSAKTVLEKMRERLGQIDARFKRF